MKRIILIICVCMLLTALSGCRTEAVSSGDAGHIMRFAIFPTGTRDESYYFVINQYGVLKCAVGVRKSDDIEQCDFLETITASSEIVLKEPDLQTIKDMAKELEEHGYTSEKQFWTDSWDAALLYNRKVYEMNYWQKDGSGEFKNLIKKIIELSPIPVVLHDWA
ncbi:MAG: hypothetical protein FWH52_04140 [Synergistaceae bacterium]|nr:hypothetical protein [Synergistaceae bacterium]